MEITIFSFLFNASVVLVIFAYIYHCYSVYFHASMDYRAAQEGKKISIADVGIARFFRAIGFWSVIANLAGVGLIYVLGYYPIYHVPLVKVGAIVLVFHFIPTIVLWPGFFVTIYEYFFFKWPLYLEH